MPRSFNTKVNIPAGLTCDPRVVARAAIGTLLVANLIAAWFVFRPLGGSAEELEAQQVSMRQQLQQRTANLKTVRALAGKIENARLKGDEFMGTYFMPRRTASSTIVGELTTAAKDAGIKPKEHAFNFEPIEGSDTLSMMTITGNYEGTYRDLLEFVNRLDRSPRFMILDGLTAAPQQGTGNLNVAIKFNTFVREEVTP